MLTKSTSGVLAALRGSTYGADLRQSTSPLASDRSERFKRRLVCTSSLFTGCGLARGTARLGAPGVGGWERWPLWASWGACLL